MCVCIIHKNDKYTSNYKYLFNNTADYLLILRYSEICEASYLLYNKKLIIVEMNSCKMRMKNKLLAKFTCKLQTTTCWQKLKHYFSAPAKKKLIAAIVLLI